MNRKKKILVIVANPPNSTPLNLGKEINDIQKAIKRSEERDEYEVELSFPQTEEDLSQTIMDHKPKIVHFGGHGTEGGLCLGKIVSNEYLIKLLGNMKDYIECVVLNACDTAKLAEELPKRIDFVVGMYREIKDQSAIAFSGRFYGAIGGGLSYEESFEMGRLAILGMVKKQDPKRREFTLAEDEQTIIDQEGNEVQDIDYHIPVFFKNTALQITMREGYLSELKQLLLEEGYQDGLKEEIKQSYQSIITELRGMNQIIQPLIQSVQELSEEVLEEIIWQLDEQDLFDMGERLKQISALQLWIAYFIVTLQQKNKRKFYRQELEKWLKKEAKNQGEALMAVVEEKCKQKSRGVDDLKRESSVRASQGLLLVVRDMETEQKFRLDAWLIKDIEEYKTSIKQDEVYALCEHLTEKEMIDLDKPLSLQLLKDFIKNYESVSLKQIKIFLPYQVIAQLEKEKEKSVDLWVTNPPPIPTMNPVPLGKDYEIILGITERLSANGQQDKWKRKYEILMPIKDSFLNQHLILESQLQQKRDAGELSEQTPYIFCKKLESSNNVNTLFRDHDSKTVIGSRLTHLCLCSDYLETLLQIIYYTGVPLMFWIRTHAEETLHSSADFEEMCHCQFKELPDRIRAKRESAYGEISHLGHHLSLILDEANLTPPSYKLEML